VTVKCPKCHSENSETKQFCADCGTQLAPSEDIPPEVTETLQAPIKELTTASTFAGRYQIIEELGKGGMGKVYKVFDKKIKEKIALKLIKPEIASDKETIERFSNEIRLARKIGHRNVCRMFDIGEEEGVHFITMEYVAGEDLKTMIRMAAGLSIGAVLSIGKQICDGLAEAHCLGVVHRDLKPQNIMIDKGGNAKIMDFGIARSIREKGITGPSVLIGTPEYMSPEQAEAKEVDYRSDIYSLGIILYEMATGRVPFEGDTALSIAMKHKGEIPKNPKQLNPNIPEDLSSVILRCLEKDRANRYQTASEVRSEMEKIEKGIPTAERVVPEKKAFTSKEITVTFGPKKVLLPVLGFAFLVIAAVVIWKILPKKEAAPAASVKKSIAVLPFEDLSPKKDHEYLCKGIAETLINALTSIEDLWVPARTSSFSFEGKKQDINEIGQKLGVDHLLEASVQVSGDQIRITARLVNVTNGSNIWSETYDRKMENIFAIQDDIAQAIVKALEVKLLGEKKQLLVKNYTDNLEAYNLYLQGRFFWNKRTAEDVKKAIDYFDQAVALDPNYALAYAGLADSYGLLPFYTSIPAKEAFSKANVAVMKALDIDENLAEAHAALGFIKMYYDWDWNAAETELKRAVQIKPGYPTAHHWYAEYLLAMGRHEEAIAEIQRARELDPLSLVINAMEAAIFVYARQPDKAIEQCRKTLELDPNFALAHDFMGFAYLEKGMREEAMEHQKRRDELGLHRFIYSYALLGERDESLRIIEEMKERWRRGGTWAYSVARLYADLGEEDLVLEWLEKSFEAREPWLIRLKVDPVFDSLRSNPRLMGLQKKIGL
jgi:serine/threonine protein kinase/tetratricopeptide (TPR) repeat protein